MRYTCYCKACDARLYLRNDETVVKEDGMKHTKPHGSMYTLYREMHCVNMMKNRCHTAPASTTVREIYDEAVVE